MFGGDSIKTEFASLKSSRDSKMSYKDKYFAKMKNKNPKIIKMFFFNLVQEGEHYKREVDTII